VKPEVGSQKLEGNGNNCFMGDGFQIIANLIPVFECDLLAMKLSALFESEQSSAKNKIGGVRNLLRNPSVVAIVSSPKLVSLLKGLAGEKIFPVRAIFFDKTTESNWRVPWHQDLAIAVTERIETNSFSGWSIKGGILHVQPPREILESMVTIRLHLDDCHADNGALKVIPSSHLQGKLSATQIAEWTSKEKAVTCEISRGGVLLMRPLLLHSSSPAKNPAHRRVLHIEYATAELPNGLQWFERK
jgi:ectoine hydroxylase-related dioxygenase (phytanoyl-CoA dioxygenase family)